MVLKKNTNVDNNISTENCIQRLIIVVSFSQDMKMAVV